MCKYPLSETFYSLQGEGCHAGMAAFFVRLKGCAAHCRFCDSKTTWTVDDSDYTSLDAIVEQAGASGATTAVVTGGEPTLYDLAPLCARLRERGLALHLETAGNNKITGEWDWICVSPKQTLPPLVENLRKANELKVVVTGSGDFEFADEMAAFTSDCVLFLQAEWGARETVTPIIVDYIKCHPEWNLSVQIHKYIGIQ
jgi:organic radical activating enzyme